MITNLNRAFALRAGAFVLVQMLAAPGVFAQGAATPASAPVSILRVAPDDPANWGFRPLRPGRGFPVPIGTTFVVTNHTSATTALNLMAIEVKAGSNWITQLTPHGPFMLSASNAVPTPGSTNGFIPGLTTTELLPHASAYATISFSGASGRTGPAPGEPVGVGMNYLAGHPTGAVWRVVFSVQEKLTGFAGASAAVTRYPETRSGLAVAGVTNAPANPFSSAYSYYGKPMRVVSEEVPTQ